MIDNCRDIEDMTVTPPSYGAIVLKTLPETGVDRLIYIHQPNDTIDGIYTWDGTAYVSICEGGGDCQAIIVSTLPETGDAGKYYVLSDGSAVYEYANNEWVQLDECVETEIAPLNITTNGTYTAPEGTAYSPVTVNVEGGATEDDYDADVIFIDYDGTVLYKYTVDEFMALTEWPANPSHPGLVADGWNWDDEEYMRDLGAAQDIVWNDFHGLEIGQLYHTDDGDTRFYISPQYDNTAVAFYIKCTSYYGSKVRVDWGDGSPTEETPTGPQSGTHQFAHTYTNAGDYVIRVTPVTGSFHFPQDIFTEHSDFVRKIEFGDKIDSAISNNGFTSTINLESVTMPRYFKNIQTAFAFNMTAYTKMRGFVIPISNIGTINVRQSNIKVVAMPPEALGYGHVQYLYTGDSELERLTIPFEVTGSMTANFSNIKRCGTYAGGTNLQNAKCLKRLYAITDMPASMCSQSGLNEVEIYTDYMYNIGNNAFYNTPLRRVRIVGVDNIPSLGTNVFYPVPGHGFVIEVPADVLEDYKNATNWSTYSAYMVGY